MSHPLVVQLRFARSEFSRALQGVTDDEARKRFVPMNCISWNIGHLAWQEQRYWLQRGQDKVLLPDIAEKFRSGGPASTPPLAEVWEAWQAITQAADPWLDALTSETIAAPHDLPLDDGSIFTFSFGTLMLRTTYHYWYHTGENMAIRQNLGQTGLPDFVGDIDGEAPYRREE